MIEWRDNLKGRTPFSLQLALAEVALAREPGSPQLLARIGLLHERLRQPHRAYDALEASLAADPDGFRSWAELAKIRWRLGHVDAAMTACRIGLERDPKANLARIWGNLLAIRQQPDDAVAAYRMALDLPGFDLTALEQLFILRCGQGAEGWLADWQALPAVYRDTAIGRAWQAAALSAAGERDAARAVMDPAAQLLRIPFEPPGEFGGIESFNRRLAGEVTADPPARPHSEDFHLNQTPRATSQPAWRALTAFIRTELERAAQQPERFGLSAERRPGAATLDSISTVLTADASNRQHVHQAGYLTAIYHVQVPNSVRDGRGDAGALELGGCDQVLPGFEPCWDRVRLKPRAGWLTLIPSHMFHDVIPTGTREPRISTAADLTPIRS